MQAALLEFRARFLAACEDAVITPEEWASLSAFATNHRIGTLEALEYIRPDALQLIERWLAFFASGGALDPADERFVLGLAMSLRFDVATYTYVAQRLDYTKTYVRVRSGDLPVVPTAVLVEAGELCHLEIPTRYEKQRARGVQSTDGQLVLTNRRLVFLSATGGLDLQWRSVRACAPTNGGVGITTSSSKGTGVFHVNDPTMVHAYIDALVRLDHRTLAAARSESRRIPRDVAAAVWSRDRGRCVECGAAPGPGVQLAFDHLIPVRLGGATTVENLQVLCTPCNLKKGSRL